MNYRITITIWQYWVLCVLFALMMRGIICIFKAFAVQNGEHIKNGETNHLKRFWKAFRAVFKGFRQGPEIDDHWIPFLIGALELASFPILLTLGEYTIIGGWIAIKTAANWGKWSTSRTAYNRFLLANLLNVFVSYIFLSKYVEGVRRAAQSCF